MYKKRHLLYIAGRLMAAAAALSGCNSVGRSVSDNAADNVISIPASQITKVSVHNFENPQRSYVLTIDSTIATLACADTGNVAQYSVSAEKVRQYLSYFSYLEYETDSSVFSAALRDSVLRRCAYSITVEQRSGERHLIQMYYKPASDTTDILGRRIAFDRYRCYMRCDTSPLRVMLWASADILAPECSYFGNHPFKRR